MTNLYINMKDILTYAVIAGIWIIVVATDVRADTEVVAEQMNRDGLIAADIYQVLTDRMNAAQKKMSTNEWADCFAIYVAAGELMQKMIVHYKMQLQGEDREKVFYETLEQYQKAALALWNLLEAYKNVTYRT